MKAIALLALLSAPPSLRLEVTPLVAQAPQDMHVRVFVERDAGNRRLEVRAVGELFERTTEVGIEGERGPAAFDWWWPSLPCGAYDVRAQVTRTDGSTRVVHRSVRYIGVFCEESQHD